ncbi:family 20 glycosylhydrolase [Zhihengliuella sp. ISTPL4]|uniref:family 20 glycosylhydrolase n=1 Tax=Zhihengliuella sp. ISTPL4 TaxID=2058657 RepID=UPI000C7D489B|nr:family 20 glycosylhydrolase [Zhihengliuella sp. ISTPL4]
MTLADLPPVLVGPVRGRDSSFPWRGLMIDSARTRFTVPVILRVIELAARYGFNRLHWHLTDDQGWRFDVPDYPLLAAIGADLPRGAFDDYNALAGETLERAKAAAVTRWSNGFYSDEEIATVVDYATAHGIEVVPEVDLPGHMSAAIAAYPELGRPAHLPLPRGSMRDHMWWPARNDLLWPTADAERFVRAVLRRVAQLFPGKLVHIGGDECAYRQWSSDPGLPAALASRGLARVEDLQAWFMDVASTELRRHGKTVAVWDEACDIWDKGDAVVIAWDEARGMERVGRSSLPYVFADARTLYLNRVDPEGSDQQNGMTPAISVDDILRAPWPETADPRCLGVQACVWSEFVLDGADLLDMFFPRLLAVSERIWNPDLDADDAAARVRREHDLLSTSGALDAPQLTPTMW